MTLYIIRHGETQMNREGIVQGSGVNSDLNEAGRQQAQSFFQHYQDVHFDYIITSALKRTHQTVEPFIVKNGHKEWIQTPDLNEISWGIHEGKKGNDRQHLSYQKLMADWEAGIYSSRIEGGESAEELKNRLDNVLNYLKNEHFLNKNILMCTHGRTLLCLITILKNHPLSMMSAFSHHNTCLYKVHFINNEFSFELENDIRHLENVNHLI
jgi:broad specificity phosphatase PhoE